MLKIPLFLREWLKQIPGSRVPLEYIRGRKQRSHRQSLASRVLPQLVAVELTNTCNLRCAKCPRSSTSRERGFIDDSLFEKILHDIKLTKATTEIALSGAGEPTLHPHLVDYVKAARSIPNIGVIGFATNGVALSPHLSEMLLDAGLTRLKASLDTDDATNFQQFTGTDAYEKVVANFRHFCEINQATGDRCQVTLKVTLYNKNDLSLANRLKEQWNHLVYQVRVTPVHNWGGVIEKNLPLAKSTQHPCVLLWHYILILWDGQITLCCMDSMEGYFKMGNIRVKNLSDYWLNDPKLLKIRQQHEALDLSSLPLCAKCNLRAYSDIDL